MGFIADPSAPVADFDKAVISLWFRVPQASIDACMATAEDALTRVIPLVTFGRPQAQTNYGGGALLAVIAGISYYGVPTIVETGTTAVDPSYIGLHCSNDGSNNIAQLTINLQSGVSPTVTGYAYDLASAVQDLADGDQYLTPGSGYILAGGIGNGQVVLTQVDNSIARANQPTSYKLPIDAPIAAGVWHHVLLSFDLSPGCSTNGVSDPLPAGVSTFSKAWAAVDDVNYDGHSLSGFYGGDPNMILPDVALDVISHPYELDASRNLYVGPASYTVGSTAIPSLSGPIGFPASADFVVNILKVEMAEFQMFTGVTLDTSVPANRRAFIGADGKPVPPKYSRASDGTVSADPSSSPVTLLGKLPDVALCQSSGNWISGKSLGSRTTHFSRTGTVKSFKPDPELGT
jgi:hypothetical protein